MIYKEQLEQIRSEIADREQDLKRELTALPDGELYILNGNQKPFYYQRFPKSGNRKKERRIGISRQPELVLQLVRKRYVTDALRIAAKDLAMIDALIKQYEPFDETSVMRDFLQRYPNLTEGLYRRQNAQTAWAAAREPAAVFYEKDLTSTTPDGTRMRSMGELYISSRLDHYEIPYRYEAPLGIPELSFVPDFTILRPRDGKLFYWEHFGRVTDHQYMSNNLYKLQKYEEYGIVPWENLIITYNHADGGLNARLIDSMIYAWLL